MIDLRSDTVTRPTPGMMEAIRNATVGDDVLGDDPTVMALEEKAAALFGMEAGLYCPSGTMTNQIAINVHTRPGDEVICEAGSHVYKYEGGGIAFNSGASVRLLQGDRGRITADQIAVNINPDDIHHPVTKLVVAENTANRGGGSCYDPAELRRISTFCREHALRLHLDGARFFNAMIATGVDPLETGTLFDTVSICLSKGLGAPVGSLLLGTGDFIRQSRRVRKLFGGAMRQSGYLAAAGIYALDHNISRLADDHVRATRIGEMLTHCSFVSHIAPVETNILIFTLSEEMPNELFLAKLKEENIHAMGIGPQTIRMVTHLDITDSMVEKLGEVLAKLQKS
ncbi:MAG: aminotransferase class I/II-fold pyridoxal phosphate-dependent enzyme [Bacteroidales bacterium]|nr:aminotransferase class I/II-fold pyridoxal phosphate-dependent enzyme [Bacteroidales bacterium]